MATLDECEAYELRPDDFEASPQKLPAKIARGKQRVKRGKRDKRGKQRVSRRDSDSASSSSSSSSSSTTTSSSSSEDVLRVRLVRTAKKPVRYFMSGSSTSSEDASEEAMERSEEEEFSKRKRKRVVDSDLEEEDAEKKEEIIDDDDWDFHYDLHIDTLSPLLPGSHDLVVVDEVYEGDLEYDYDQFEIEEEWRRVAEQEEEGLSPLRVPVEAMAVVAADVGFDVADQFYVKNKLDGYFHCLKCEDDSRFASKYNVERHCKSVHAFNPIK